MGSSREHISDQIDLYLTGALPPDEEDAFEGHLMGCPACRAQADDSSLAALAVASLPPEVVKEIEYTAPPAHASRPPFSPGYGIVVYAILLLVWLPTGTVW